jgi:glucose/arabinose dehydrogenase
MRNIVARLIIGGTMTAIGMFGADTSLGTWKFNVAKSKSTSTNPVKSRTEVREATPDGWVKVTSTREWADGTTVNFSYTFRYDGREYPVTGGPFDTISVKRVNANTTSFEVVKKTNGMYHQTGRLVVSKDGKRMTMTARGTDAKGKSVTAINIFDKR